MPQNRVRVLRHYRDAVGELCRDCRGSLQTPVAGATSDSREVQPGWLFCAIRGQRVDGARFIPDALAAGATAIAACPGVAVPDSVPLLTVTDDYAAAGRIAECLYDFPARKLDLFGITGTNGKTTTAFILRDMLRGAAVTTGMIGTVIYDVGDGAEEPAARTTPTPFDLQERLCRMVGNGLQAVVLEASSHALAQCRLGTASCRGAVFTNLTQDHFDYHGSFEDYFAAKARLFTEHLAASGPAVVNIDDPYGHALAQMPAVRERHDVIGFGRSADARIRLVAQEMTPTRSTLQLQVGEGRILRLSSPLIGDYNLHNIAGACALALALGISEETIQRAVKGCRGAPGRLQAIHAPEGFSVYVDYAHTDDALRNVLTALRKTQPRRLIVVFGCGGDRDSGKRPLMGRAAADIADCVIVTSDNPRSEDPAQIIRQILEGIPRTASVQNVPDRGEAIRRAVAMAEAGDVVLVAGKGHETYQEIQGRSLPFDDAVEVRQALEARGS